MECMKCNYSTTNKQNYERHLQCKRHLEEKTENYHCDKCNYTTTNKQNYERHIQSNKHIEGSKKFEPIFCPCCRIHLYSVKQHMEHKKSIKHKRNRDNYKVMISKPVTVPEIIPTFSEPKPKPSLDHFRPFHNIVLITPETSEIIKVINQVLKEKEKETLPEDTERIRIYARRIGDDYKVGVISMETKDYFQLGLLKKEKLKEITIPKNGYKNIDDDDDGFGGFHHILGYIKS
jgi:hypothetical protein